MKKVNDHGDGFFLSPEDWEAVIQNLQDSAGIVAEWIRDENLGNNGDKAAEAYLCHIAFACAAMDFVKQNAADCLHFTPMYFGEEG